MTGSALVMTRLSSVDMNMGSDAAARARPTGTARREVRREVGEAGTGGAVTVMATPVSIE
jgi:hypothetical protein